MLISGLISAKGRAPQLAVVMAGRVVRADHVSVAARGTERVLLRPKFRPYVTVHEVRAYVALLQRLSSAEPDPEVTAGLTSDPGDDYLVALARAAGAAFFDLRRPSPHGTQASEATGSHSESLSEATCFLKLRFTFRCFSTYPSAGDAEA